ncbi:glycosyl transferase family 1 (plasmid) [Roseovarius faecimaris]|uniref:Glycosyl transferase family 1 n=2 Tax=Roseovarius faecimaris TaxID=2494550 RepID=A0A6I6INP0_9RHOB|nr:glycosyl transferase family 1 [Roseovarius faecimaris]
MAVYRPEPAHLTAQLQSIAAQEGARVRLIAVIADMVSGDLVRDQAGECGLELHMVQADTELDAVRAFETGLIEALALQESEPEAPAPLIALSDQDDIWHADRLAKGIAALEATGAQLVHSDARLVAADGTTEIKPSMFAFERRLRKPGLRGLLYRNNITGMTLLMRPEVARIALPFPPQSGVHFYHDLWLGLVAGAIGGSRDGVHLIDVPLVDYRQHEGNVMGAVDRQRGWLRGLKAKKIDRMWLRREAAPYALARYLARSLRVRMNEATQDGRLRTAPDLRPLRPYLRGTLGSGTHFFDALRLTLTGKPGLGRIAAGFGIVNLGRAYWSIRQAMGEAREDALEGFDARMYSLSPGLAPAEPKRPNAKLNKPVPYEGLIEERKLPRWTPEFSAPGPALNILVPTLNPTEVFAGIVTAFDIGLGLAARGYRVRFIATDLPVSSAAASRGFVLRRLSAEARAGGAAERISLHCGIQSDAIASHKDDVFLATAWWSAHVIDTLIREQGYAQTRFFYLIQDFEPNFYAWGPEFANASASYEFNFEPIFNTSLLRDYFAGQGYGFATPGALAFHPAIEIDRYAGPARPERPPGKRRLALYGRPEVERNMYSFAVEALAGFITEEGLTAEEIELISIGLIHPPVSLPNGLMLTSLGKLPWEEYPDYLREVDLGLSLMYSPHPSHPPIEMAASGVRVVTNSFGPKDLSKLSPAIASVEPTTPAVIQALRAAWAAPPVTAQERKIDLSQLGLHPDGMLDALDTRLARHLSKDKTTS